MVSITLFHRPGKAMLFVMVKACLHYQICFHTLSILLPSIGKAHCKAECVIYLVPLPKIDELYAILNGSTVYSSLDYTSGYNHITLSPAAEKKSAFITPFGKFEFKRIPFALAPTLHIFSS